MQNIPDSFQGSQAIQFVQSRGWDWKPVDSSNIELEQCLFCKKTGYAHFYMEIHGNGDSLKNRDGLYLCHRCGKSGNLHSLKEHLGIVVPGVSQLGSTGNAGKETEPMPDINAMHQALLEDEAALDYLMNGRGFSMDVIQRQKIGLHPKRYFRECGEVRALVYPYLVNGNCVFVHYRTLPTMPLAENKVPKAFSSLKGWDAPLYNGEILLPGLKELVMVEGEANCIAAIEKGVSNICGAPGANFKKAEWIETLDKLELEKIYICYDKDRVGQKAAQTLASRIGIEKCWKIKLPDFTVTTDEGETRSGKDLNEWFAVGGGTAEAFEQLKEEAILFDVDGVSSSTDAVTEFLEELQGKGSVEPKYKTQWESLNKLVGFDDGDVIDVLAPEKIGKAQPLSVMIKTTTGWTRMGDIRVGDSLASIDGEESVVTGIFPQGAEKVYKITFSDGRSTMASGKHLWSVSFAHNGQNNAGGKDRPGEKVFTTEALRFFCLNQFGCNRHNTVYIPRISGEFGTRTELPIDPWLLGFLIGDGCITEPSPSFYTADEELLRKVRGIVEPLGQKVCPMGTNSKYSYRIASEHGRSAPFENGERRTNPVTMALRDLGLWKTDCFTKFVPADLFEQPRDVRVSLLQGLMDSDGTVSNNTKDAKNGSLSFTTTSKQLANDVQQLVRSIGGMATIYGPFRKTFRYKGEKRTGSDTYRVNIRSTDGKELFSLERKRALVGPRTNECRLMVTSIEEAGEQETQCIMVSHPSHLYVTDEFIVTHNTTFAMNLVEHMVNTYHEDAIIICLEMTRAKMARKWIAHKAQIADNIPKSPEEAQTLLQQFLTAIPQVQDMAATRIGTLYFCLPTYKTDDDLYKLIRECIRRYGVKWIVIDNLQRWADTTPSGTKGRTVHLSEISKVTSQIAKEYGVQMVRILQPHRIAEGKIVTSDNTDGSSQIAKDCDANITLHRNKLGELTKDQFETCMYVEQEQAFDDKTLLGVGLSRYSGGGYTTLSCDGSRSTFNEFTVGQVQKMQAEANKNVGYESQLKALNITLATPIPGKEPQVGSVPISAPADEAEITV